MENSGMKRNVVILSWMIAILVFAFIVTPLRSHADDNYWIGNSGDWTGTTNWSLGYEPIAGNNVYLSPQTANTLVTYDTLNNPVLGTVQIDGSGGYSLELQQTQGTLTSTTQYIGYNGNGIYTQTGGANSIGITNSQGTLYLGYNSGSSGTYNLSGGQLSTYGLDEYIGYSGNATFIQTGGSNSAGEDLVLGYNAGSTFSYNLSGGYCGAGYLEIIGSLGGTGTFTQSGGSNVADSLSLGASSTYNMSGGEMRFQGESISGKFTQTGGTNRQSRL